MFRFLIEQLFAIHGETKLNMICILGGDPQKWYGYPFSLPWCRDLNHPSISSTNSKTSTTLEALTYHKQESFLLDAELNIHKTSMYRFSVTLIKTISSGLNWQ
jgi:hypothetical protein